eukprot:2991944-Prymnesium_polylepis.1
MTTGGTFAAAESCTPAERRTGTRNAAASGRRSSAAPSLRIFRREKRRVPAHRGSNSVIC